jgi:DNA/RNA endonuclease YhcR with UshA esterase domain
MTHRPNVRFIPLALALVLALVPLAAAAQVVSIADARAAALGSVVTVQGFVTVPSGRYSSSTFDQGFAIQDSTAGIYVSVADNPGLHLFRRVRVTGTVADDGFGQLVLRPASLADVDRLPGAHRIPPAPVATGDVGEDTEGSLVTVTGTVTRLRNDLPFGYGVFLDDGSGEVQAFIPASTGVNPFAIPFVKVGKRIQVIGLSGQFEEMLEVLPRFRSDLRRAR